MKKNYLFKYLIAIMILGLISCESENTNSLKQGENLSFNNENNSIFRMMMENECATVESFDLFDREYDTQYGELTVYFDGINLILEYHLSNSEWNITESRFWYGAPTDWTGGNTLPNFSEARFDKVTYPDGTTSITIERTLTERMECIIIQTKILVDDGSLIQIVVPFRTEDIYLWSDPICAEECCEMKEETAFGGETSGDGSAWWFAYDTQTGGKQPIFAGQKEIEGAYVEVVDDKITIELGECLELKTDDKEAVKVEGYDELPDKRPPAGKFTLYKGRDLVVDGDGSRFYVVHLDVMVCKNEGCFVEP